MYILIKGSKDSYDRSIDIDILAAYNEKQDIVQALIDEIDYCEGDEGLSQAIDDKKECYITEWGRYKYLGYDTDGDLIYYSTGCPSDNEYCGNTYKIFKVGE